MIDTYIPIYRLLLDRGIHPHEADVLDLTTTAVLLGVTFEPEPSQGDGTPSWWRGSSDAVRSNVLAAQQLGFTVSDVS